MCDRWGGGRGRGGGGGGAIGGIVVEGGRGASQVTKITRWGIFEFQLITDPSVKVEVANFSK